MYKATHEIQKRRIVVVSVLLGLLACYSLYGQLLPPDQLNGGRVTRTLSGSGDYWHLDIRIDQPRVNRHQTFYDRIHFEPEDRVQISAGGCVQTGGRGKTWKRYVDPQGPNSDHFYHGLISVPGIIGDSATRESIFALYHGTPAKFRRIQDINHRTFTMPPLRILSDGAGHDSWNWGSGFVLGYEDDDYSDNGYDGHDDGTGDQCKGGTDAFIIIGITRKMPESTQIVNGQVKCTRTFNGQGKAMNCGSLLFSDRGSVWVRTSGLGAAGPFICYDPVGSEMCDLNVEGPNQDLVCRPRGNPKGPVCTNSVWEPDRFPTGQPKLPS